MDDMAVCTGPSNAVISPDILEEIGVKYENINTIYEAYGIGDSVPFSTNEDIDIKGFVWINIHKLIVTKTQNVNFILPYIKTLSHIGGRGFSCRFRNIVDRDKSVKCLWFICMKVMQINLRK